MLQKQKSANLIPMRVRVKAVIKDGTIMLLKGPVCCSIGEVVPATGKYIYLYLYSHNIGYDRFR